MTVTDKAVEAFAAQGSDPTVRVYLGGDGEKAEWVYGPGRTPTGADAVYREHKGYTLRSVSPTELTKHVAAEFAATVQTRDEAALSGGEA